MARATATLRRCSSSPRSTPECAAGAERGGSDPPRCFGAPSAGSRRALSAVAGRHVAEQRVASGPHVPRRD
eukprot:3933994-Alexandrium_andersonii.AAC.1